MNLNPNRVIFYSVDLSLSNLSKFIKSLISHVNSSFDLIEFEEYLENTLILRGFDPYSPLYCLIHDYFLYFVSLELFLTRLSVYSTTSWNCLVNTHPLYYPQACNNFLSQQGSISKSSVPMCIDGDKSF